MVRGLTNLRANHPALAHGELGAIPTDSKEWMVFEKFEGADHYLVLINMTATGQDYRFHKSWLPQYRGAQLIFWSDGSKKEWRDTTNEMEFIEDSAFVGPFGLVVLRQVKKMP